LDHVALGDQKHLPVCRKRHSLRQQVINIAQRVNKENSMQAVVPFVVMILLLVAVIYIARWNANRVKSRR
jgi:hypothetical protein